MEKLIKSILIFAIFCALPSIGIFLTKLGYPEFKPDYGFSIAVALSIIFGLMSAFLIYYLED